MPVIFLLEYFVLPAVLYKSSLSKLKPYTYNFMDKQIIAGDEFGTVTFHYLDIMKVYTIKNTCYIFCDKINNLVIDKSDSFENGSYEDILSLLKNNMQKGRYKEK
jgi:hypothetical protein